MRHWNSCVWTVFAAGLLPATLSAAVSIKSLSPSLASPQPLGTTVTWSVVATDTHSSSLTFQFNVAPGPQPFAMVRDFNSGTFAKGVWTSQPFNWTTIAGEGTYTIQVVAKDFVTGESASATAPFTLTSLAPANAVVTSTANPLVALFSAPSCAAGSSMRVAFYTGTSPANYTNWQPCNPPVSMNFYIAGMYPSAAYTMYSQTLTGGNVTSGANLSFTTGSIPASLGKGHSLPSFTVKLSAGSQSDTSDGMILWGFTGTTVPVATDLNGNVMWYYANGAAALLTRLVSNPSLLTIQNGTSWNSSDITLQMVREIDLAGNTIRETNTGIIAHQLAAMGSASGGPCAGVANPAPVGTSCLNEFDHEVIRFEVNGQPYTAIMAHTEKVYPAGTQGGNPQGPAVDILGDMAIVLNSQWQVVWYFDPFEQLDIARAAVLGETCTNPHCAIRLLLSNTANDWTHGNTIQYLASSGDLLLSLRDLDWLVKVNYANGAGAGNVLWRMGQDGDFTINAPKNDSWPWFSHQHDSGYANNGAGPLVLFDNGNTRVAPPPVGLGKGASRGMALTVDEANMQVTPVLSVGLGTYAPALGSAQLLPDGIYMFQPGIPHAAAIEILPSPPSINGTQVLNVFSPETSYRAWQIPNLYSAPSW